MSIEQTNPLDLLQNDPIDTVQFAPSYGRLSPAGDHWQVAIRGRVVMPRPDNLRKSLLLRMFRRAIQAQPDELASPLLQRRIHDFMMLGLRNRPLNVRVGNRIYPLKKRSKTGGYFSNSIRIPVCEIDLSAIADASPMWLDYCHDEHHDAWQPGRAMLVQPTGPSVISDVDDTLKLTNATNRRELLLNTFLNPYQSISGMASLFRMWGLSGTAIHYVSASPWQLFEPLREFLLHEGFPDGSFDLRPVKLQGTGTLRLLLGGKRDKRKSVRTILRWFPHRKFLLIGDSGERDPEIYGWAARKFSQQVELICIRRVGAIRRKRLRRAFREVPKNKIRLFEHAEELSEIKPIAFAGWAT